MRHRVTVALMFITVMLGAALAPSAAHASRAVVACESKWVMLKGDLVEVYCGPATATVHAHGKTLVFVHGTCQIMPGAFDLKLGIYEQIPKRYKYFRVEGSARHDGTLGGMYVSAEWNLSGTRVPIIRPRVTWAGHRTRGTFTGKLSDGSRVTGSFRC